MFIENLKSKLIRKDFEETKLPEPELLKKERTKQIENALKQATEHFEKSCFPDLIKGLEGLFADLTVTKEEVGYDTSGKFDPHFSVNLGWDYEEEKWQMVDKSGELVVTDIYRKNKNITLIFFPEEIVEIDGNFFGSTTLLGDNARDSKLQEKAFAKAYKRPERQLIKIK
jgi:hypothetical protein